MQLLKALERLKNTVLAEVLWVVTLLIFEHLGECAAIHQFHKDPEAVLVVERFEAFDNVVILGHLHDSNFVFNRFALFLVLRLGKFQSKKHTVTDSLATEYASEAALARLAHDLIIRRGIFLFNIGGFFDWSCDFFAGFQVILGLVELADDRLKNSAGVLGDLFFTEDSHLHLNCLGNVDPFKRAVWVALHRELDP